MCKGARKPHAREEGGAHHHRSGSVPDPTAREIWARDVRLIAQLTRGAVAHSSNSNSYSNSIDKFDVCLIAQPAGLPARSRPKERWCKAGRRPLLRDVTRAGYSLRAPARIVTCVAPAHGSRSPGLASRTSTPRKSVTHSALPCSAVMITNLKVASTNKLVRAAPRVAVLGGEARSSERVGAESGRADRG